MIDANSTRYLKTFFLDIPKDVKEYEGLLNDASVSVVNRETFKTKETDETIDADHVVTKTSRERICYVVDYEKTSVE